ncbi:MAG: TIGR04283 family arsenosugar biosynthesis glycosyltransferase [Burkholderiales bacterium]
MRLSIVVPVLNEGRGVAAALAPLAPLRAAGHQVIVVDGGSADDTMEHARSHADTVISANRGRAMQMNAGAAQAGGDTLLFLHADTRLPAGADRMIGKALTGSVHRWGRFDVTIDGSSRGLAVVAGMMNWRSRVTGIATGDQAFFVERATFVRVGGFPPIPLMEDIALSRILKRESPPACLRARVITSGRRWDRDGLLRTIVTMWALRVAYFLGVGPERLARYYYGR